MEERDAGRGNGGRRGMPGTSMNKGFRALREKCYDTYCLQIDFARVLLRSVNSEFFIRERAQKINAAVKTKSEKN